MGKSEIIRILAAFWPYVPLVVLIVVAWLILRPRKPPTI